MVKYILQEMNDLANNGERKVFPKVQVNYTVGKDEFVDLVQKHVRAVDKGVVTAVMTGVADVLAEMLSMGCNVTVDEIGTFSMSLKFLDEKTTELETDDDPMIYRRVGVKDVNLKISPELRNKLYKKTKFTREASGVNTIKKKLSTVEERIARGLSIIDDKGFVTLKEYADINNISHSTASRELSMLSSDSTSPITSSGLGTHKVWVRRNEE